MGILLSFELVRMGWKVHGEGPDIVEIWESIRGDLWFISEHENEDIKFGFARLYSMPEFAEWGSFSLSEIKDAFKGLGVWKVEEKNWCNIVTYEDNLLVEVNDGTKCADTDKSTS